MDTEEKMGRVSEWWNGGAQVPTPPTPIEPPKTFKRKFAIGDDYATWQSLVGADNAQVTRAMAMTVPAVKAARDKFCSLGMLPLHNYRDKVKVERKLFDHPENELGIVRAVTMAKLIDDLFFHASSLWRITHTDWTGYATSVQHIPWGKWTQDEDGVIRIGGEVVNPKYLIKFDSPNDPFLIVGAPIVKSARLLQYAADKYAENPEMLAWFVDKAGREPDEDDVQELLNDWQGTRRDNKVGFIPDDLEYHESKRMTADELQLIGAREFIVAEVSRLTGINPNWLALPVTTRTYSNMESERKDFLDFPAQPYIATIEQRLSFGDVTPQGQYARFALDGFLRSSTSERYASYRTALGDGTPFLTVSEVRDLEDRPPLEGGDDGQGNPGVPE